MPSIREWPLRLFVATKCVRISRSKDVQEITSLKFTQMQRRVYAMFIKKGVGPSKKIETHFLASTETSVQAQVLFAVLLVRVQEQ